MITNIKVIFAMITPLVLILQIRAIISEDSSETTNGARDVHLFQWCWGYCTPKKQCLPLQYSLASGLIPHLLSPPKTYSNSDERNLKNKGQNKWNIMKNLPKLLKKMTKPDDLVIFSDMIDVLFLGKDIKNEIISKYDEKYRGKVVFGSETNCWTPYDDNKIQNWLQKKFGIRENVDLPSDDMTHKYICFHPKYPKPSNKENDHKFMNTGFYIGSSKVGNLLFWQSDHSLL